MPVSAVRYHPTLLTLTNMFVVVRVRLVRNNCETFYLHILHVNRLITGIYVY